MFHFYYNVLSHFQTLSPTKSPILPYDAFMTRLIFLSLRAEGVAIPVVGHHCEPLSPLSLRATVGSAAIPVVGHHWGNPPQADKL